MLLRGIRRGCGLAPLHVLGGPALQRLFPNVLLRFVLHSGLALTFRPVDSSYMPACAGPLGPRRRKTGLWREGRKRVGVN